MAQKKTLLFIVILGITVFYCAVSLFMTDDDSSFITDVNMHDKSDVVSLGNAKGLQNDEGDKTIEAIQTSDDAKISKPEITLQKKLSLPKAFTLVGIKQAVSSANQSVVLLQHQDGLQEYKINEFLLDTDMLLVEIQAEKIVLTYHNELFSVSLTPPNLLSNDYKDKERSYAQMLSMSIDDIGNRPRIIEHFATLTSTPYIADAKLVSPGISPHLFQKIGFRTDDLVKSINGKSVTVDAEFELIKREIPNASTLTFLVMRKGRLITLYLDIPSETLELKRE